MPKIYDVVKAMGQYTGQDGQQKTRWLKCGMIVQNQNGKMALKLDAIPLGTPVDGDGGLWFALMTPQQQNTGQQPGVPAPAPAAPVPAMPGAVAPVPNTGQPATAPVPGQPAPNAGFTDDDIPF